MGGSVRPTTCSSPPTAPPKVIVGVDIVTAGSDMAQLAPMVQQVQQRLGRAPDQWLVDGGFPAHEQIDAVAGKTALYAPVPKAKDEPGGSAAEAKAAEPPAPPLGEFDPKPGESEAVAQWRARMNSDAAGEIYKSRAATAECVNAQARNRGLQRMPVRGLTKVKCVVQLYVLAHNLT